MADGVCVVRASSAEGMSGELSAKAGVYACVGSVDAAEYESAVVSVE